MSFRIALGSAYLPSTGRGFGLVYCPAAPYKWQVDLGSQLVAQCASLDAAERSYLRNLAEFDELELYRAEGCVSAARWLVTRAGRSMARASSDVELAARLYGKTCTNKLPLVAARVEAGEISVDAARSVARSTSALDPAVLAEVEPELAHAATWMEPGKLYEAASRVTRSVLRERERRDRLAHEEALRAAKEAADAGELLELAQADAEVAAAVELEALHKLEEDQGRYLDVWQAGRMIRLEGMLPRVEGEAVIEALRKFSEPSSPMHDCPEVADTRSYRQRYADGLMQMARRCQAADTADFVPGPVARVHVVAQLEDLISLSGIDPRVGCTSSGGDLEPEQMSRVLCDSEISVSVVDRMVRPISRSGLDLSLLDKALQSISPALGGVGFEVLEQGRKKRLATAAQRDALRIRDRGCVYPQCDRPHEWTEAHHLKDWQFGGFTDIDELASMCSKHHHFLHTRKWSLRRTEFGSWEVVKD